MWSGGIGELGQEVPAARTGFLAARNVWGRQPVGTESSSQLPASQKTGPWSRGNKKLDSANNLNEFRSRFFPRASSSPTRD